MESQVTHRTQHVRGRALSSGGNNNNGFNWNWGYNFHPQINIVRAGVNYHFNWAAPAPVLAKY